MRRGLKDLKQYYYRVDSQKDTIGKFTKKIHHAVVIHMSPTQDY